MVQKLLEFRRNEKSLRINCKTILSNIVTKA